MNKDILAKAIKLRHELHMHPEVSMKEVETKKRLMEFICEETSLEVVDRGRWFYACYDSHGAGKTHGDENRRVVAFRADMDALPLNDDDSLEYCSVNGGTAHRCGHDGHSAVLAAFACELDKSGADRDVYLIFQHAEETGAGAAECAELLEEKGISEIYAFHNWSGFPEGSVVVSEGTVMCASEGLSVKMTGKPAHASQPEDGLNPVKALCRLVLEIEKMTENADLYRGDVMATIVGINCGGANFGIAPDEGELNITIRALREKDMNEFRNIVMRMARDIAEACGFKVDFDDCDIFPETANDRYSFEKVMKCAESTGHQTIIMDKPFRSSEDFGHYQKKCRGTMFFIGNGEDYPQVHSEKYDFNDRIIETAVDVFCRIAETN